MNEENTYRLLKLIRNFEVAVADIYPSDKIKSPVHLSIGQEFVSVAFCQHLKTNDFVGATYRGHAAYLAKGGCPRKLMAELYGKATGCAKGRGGSMHLIEPSVNFIGTSAVVGTGIPVATGHALTQKYLKTGNVVVCFFGDGASEEGAFYESLNFAGLHKLPIVFVVENNRLAIHEPLEKRWADTDLMQRTKGFGVETLTNSGDDFNRLSQIASDVINNARNFVPTLIEVDCYRWLEHVGPNDDHFEAYRDQKNLSQWKQYDALEKIGKQLSNSIRLKIDQEVKSIVEDAIEFAESSEEPESKELYEHVYS
jgi:TPP-dependent pyruvate/acetoin dehydrogenase alpha subunit